MERLGDEMKTVAREPAPPGLRARVLGSLGVSPSGQPVQRKRKTVRLVLAGAGVVVVVLFCAAIVMPSFSRAHEAARRGEPVAMAVSPEVASDQVQMKPPLSPPAAGLSADQKKMRMVDGRVTRIAGKQGVGGERSFYSPMNTGRAAMPIIIKTAEVSVEVRDFARACDQAVSICTSTGGFVSDSSSSAAEESKAWGTLTLRVPVESFEATVERLGKLGVVQSKAIHGEDVTSQVVDLESSLRNKRAEERQYLDVMRQAKRVSDIIYVSDELYRVRGEIEEAQGRLNYLRASADMATISLSLSENEASKPLPKSSLGRALSDAVASLIRTLATVASALIWLAVYCPFWLPVVGIVIYLRRRAAATRKAD